jgi:hypothetical protein
LAHLRPEFARKSKKEGTLSDATTTLQLIDRFDAILSTIQEAIVAYDECDGQYPEDGHVAASECIEKIRGILP